MNWQSVINSLIGSGLSIDDIATEMGVTANAVREITAGRTKSPRYEAAMRLIALCKKKRIAPAQDKAA
ncbi:MAG: hypothetical protein JSS52_00710 [Proteobacteria bacterium]|nr:hypothetical protein [Pseudomonadota bacterium]